MWAWGLFLRSNSAFLEQAYRSVLGREIDEHGLAHYTRFLQDGHSRAAVLVELIQSDEFLNRIFKGRVKQLALKNIREMRPANYHIVPDTITGQNMLVFAATDDKDFDWLEKMIIQNNYYEKDGVWSVVIDLDKRVMAEVMAAFRPRKALEMGCANGAVMQCLFDLGIYSEGVEISQLSIQRAFPAIKARIHNGDLLTLQLPADYDLIFGLDIFEHLNPNKLDAYLSRIYSLLEEGGYVFANIPAYGDDPRFGLVFPIYAKDWEEDVQATRRFSTLHVDGEGYPINGHLVWADTKWWEQQFERQGFRRETEIEEALHAKYDDYMNKTSVARRSYYVFSKNADPSKNQTIVERISTVPSQVLGALTH
jgi:hypothetical protein